MLIAEARRRPELPAAARNAKSSEERADEDECASESAQLARGGGGAGAPLRGRLRRRSADHAPARRGAAAAPGRPGGLWFYRDRLPSESLNLTNIDVNGGYFGSVANGGAFYCDVAPGRYHIAPQSYNRDFDQNQDVTLAAGQQAYVEILSLQSWDGACRDCARDTFYARLVPPPATASELAWRGAGQ